MVIDELNIRQTSGRTTMLGWTHFECLKEMFARWIPLPFVEYRMRREVGELIEC